MIDVSWCVSADHGGIPQFRLCNNEGLVSAVTTPDKPPSLADLEALEQCFQRGLLRCDDVDGNDCSQVEVCGEYAADWGACAEPGKYLHCRDEQKTEGKYWACVNTAETCDHGKMARYKLRIPSDFPASTHTILSYRWDTYENNEVFVGCADIAITGDGDSAPVKPRPTPRPTKGDVATPKPTPRPTTKAATPRPTSKPTEAGEDDDADAYCCQNDGTSCDGCSWIAPPGNYCAQSEGNCGNCGEIFAWCGGGGSTDDEPAPATPRPTVKPTAAAPQTPRPTPRPQADNDDGSSGGEGYCCFWPEGPGGCGQCTSPAGPENWCAKGKKECVEDCGHTWCDGDSPVTDDGGDPDTDDRATCDLPEAGAPVDATGFAREHGKLRLDGVQLVDASGAPVQLLGMSSHGLHWFPDCYTFDAIEHLVKTWGTNVFRAAMYVGEGGYASDPSVKQKVKDIVAWTKQLGIYCIIDWHVLTPGDPNAATYDGAVDFWKEMATLYKDEDHVIYEIANEPNNVAWSRVKEYHNRIIGAIRAIDAESIIIAGTTTWSQDIHLAAEDPVAEPYNVMYAFHFYACSHGSLLQRVKDFRTKIPIFVSEWGTSSYSGDGGVCQCEAKEFLDVFSDKDGSGGVTLSMAQWSWADKSESSAALAPGACRNGGDWDSLSESGAFLRAYVRDATRA